MLNTRLTQSEQDALHDTYRYLHRYPELSMQEHQTADFIEERLTELGIENFRCGGTGVVGIQRNGAEPVVGFRADMDGLPIQEDTGAEYSSEEIGLLPDGTRAPVMHGCGHDSHVAVALAAVELLVSQTDAWSGTIVWVFQPGEETGQGAAAMVEEGLWDFAPRPQVMLGQHVGPVVPAGSVGVVSGTAMAIADSLKVTVMGTQSHGSQPQESIDPIVQGAHMVTRLQTIVSREIAAQTAAVVTCGTFHAGLKDNIIPDRAEFTLNIRTMTEETRTEILDAVVRIVNAEAVASGAERPTIDRMYSFPRLYNDPTQTEAVSAALREELGAERVEEVPPLMGSEDFGRLGDSIDIPSVFWFFGAYDQNAVSTPVNHSPEFLPDIEPTLTTGVRAAVAVLGHYLGAE